MNYRTIRSFLVPLSIFFVVLGIASTQPLPAYADSCGVGFDITGTCSSGQAIWCTEPAKATDSSGLGFCSDPSFCRFNIPVWSGCYTPPPPPPPPTPSCVAGAGTACSASNACGTNTGTVQCDGSCSASAPSIPSNYGRSCTSGANACGMTNAGSIMCSGVCSAGTPSNALCPVAPSCTPSGACAASTCAGSTCSDSCGNVYAGIKICAPSCTPSSSCAASTCTGSTCSDTCGNSYAGTKICTPAPTASLSASPTLVPKNGTATLTWTSTGAASCTITRNGVNMGATFDKKSGSNVNDPTPITTQTVYQSTCGSATAKAVVNVVPVYNEY